jgi:hypothetical protein
VVAHFRHPGGIEWPVLWQLQVAPWTQWNFYYYYYYSYYYSYSLPLPPGRDLHRRTSTHRQMVSEKWERGAQQLEQVLEPQQVQSMMEQVLQF